MLAGPVEYRTDLESPRDPELFSQFQSVGGGRLAGEQVVGDRAQGKDVEVLANDLAVDEGLGGHVGCGGAIDQLVHVDCAGHPSPG